MMKHGLRRTWVLVTMIVATIVAGCAVKHYPKRHVYETSSTATSAQAEHQAALQEYNDALSALDSWNGVNSIYALGPWDSPAIFIGGLAAQGERRNAQRRVEVARERLDAARQRMVAEAGENEVSIRAAPRKRTRSKQAPIRRVRCLYEQKPWLNLDKAGDRDPEGIRYRIFLDPGTGRGELREGTFHIELYRIDRVAPDQVERTLVSDWHYPTSAVHRIAKPGMLGDGYFAHLMWADKDIAGHEIELITCFEDPEGMRARSGTKRLRVPKYTP